MKGPRGGKQYTCNKCKKVFSSNKVHVDHIDPVVPVDTAALSMSWDTIISRLYCSLSNLQVLCVNCHKAKSRREAAERKNHRDSKREGGTNRKGLQKTASKRRKAKPRGSGD